MKSKYLFPNSYKWVGYLLSIPSLILGSFCLFSSFQFDFLHLFGYNMTEELAIIGCIVGLSLIAFSKTNIEDEYVVKIRLESLQWAFYINFVLLILCTLFVHDLQFFMVVIFNMFTPLIIFIIRFHYLLFVKTS